MSALRGEADPAQEAQPTCDARQKAEAVNNKRAGLRSRVTGPYSASLGCSRIALSMNLVALRIASPLEKDTPVLFLFSFRFTVHLKPVGLAVCTT